MKRRVRRPLRVRLGVSLFRKERMYHEFEGIGHLGVDPEMKYTPSGVAWTSFTVAFSKKWKDASGVAQEKTLWVRVNAWRDKAELCAKYLRKGSKVFVKGELDAPRGYTDRDGNLRASLDMTLSRITFLSAAGDVLGEAPGAPSTSGSPIAEEDIPF